MKPRVAFVAGSLLVTSALALAYLAGSRGPRLEPTQREPAALPGSPSRAEDEAAIPTPTASVSKAAPPSDEMRQRVTRAIEQATKVVDRPSLEAYLASLEERARAQRRVTALEVEPGIQMIQQLDESGQRLASFTRTMEELQRSFEPAPAPRAEPQQRLDALSASIADATDESERGRAIRAYLDVMRELPPGSEGEAQVELQRLTKTQGGAPQGAPVAAEAQEHDARAIERPISEVRATLDP